VTYPQDQEYRTSGAGPAADDDYPESTGDEDLARAEADDDEDDELDDDQDVVIERDVIVAEVIDEDPDSPATDGDAGEREEDTMPSSLPMQTVSAGNDAASGPARPTGTPPAQPRHSDEQMSQQWHDIQAGFVDDPRGAVKLAAKAADDALAGLVTALRERQAALGSAETTEDTEVLRSALREYREFCQGIEEIGRELPQPVSAR
jgi:hypothetical protein